MPNCKNTQVRHSERSEESKAIVQVQLDSSLRSE